MRRLIFDIETIGEDFDHLDKTTQEVLTRWIKKESSTEEEYQAALEELKNGLGFSPLTGQIVAIGVLDVEKGKGVVYYEAPDKDIPEFEEKNIRYSVLSEKEMLQKFWEGAENYQQFISFNGRSFDVPFLMIRSAVHKIRPSINLLPYRYSKYYETNHIDLLDQLSFLGVMRRKGNLHLWCRAFGIKSPKADGISGDDVGKLFREKKYLEIARYNAEDLWATKALYEKWRRYLAF